MKCAVCSFDLEAILSVRDDGQKKLVLCPNHELMVTVGLVNESEINYLPSEVQPEGKCDLCTNDKIYYKNSDTEFDVCKNHVDKLVKRNLSPSEYFVLAEKHGSDTFILHDDFYDPETGEAFQPVEEE